MFNKKKYKQIEKNKHGKLISLLLLCFVVMLSIANAAMNGEISVSGDAVFRVDTDVRITDLYLSGTSNEGLEEYSSSYSVDTVQTGISLPNLNSTVSYNAVLTNKGNTAVTIDEIEKINYNNENITYSINETLPIVIEPQEEKELEITFEYGDTLTEVPENNMLDSTLKLELNNVESVLALGTDGDSTTTFFNNGPITKESVEIINFLPSVEVGEDALGYWDASYNKDNSVIAWYTDSDENQLYELNIGGYGKVYAQNGNNLFLSFTKVTSINFGEVFDTSKTTSMYAMFMNCSSLTNLDLSLFDTSNVTSMKQMFYFCNLLEKINLTNFNTSNVTSMASMFSNCKKLSNLNASSFSTFNTTNMSGMFELCSSLTELNVSNFDTSCVTDMSQMFKDCSLLTKLDIINFNTSNVRNMSGLFRGCAKLTELNLSSFDTSNVTSMYFMFYYCISLENLELNNFNTSKVTNMSSMFQDCHNLLSLNLSNFDTSKVTKFSSIFRDCKKLSNLNISSFDVTSTKSLSGFFYGCLSLTSLDVSSFDTSNITDMSSMFYSCANLINLNLSNFNTSKVTNMYRTFMYCQSIKNINLSNFETSNVTNMHEMFSHCFGLENINLDNFNTLKVTNMREMFIYCQKLVSISFKNADFSNVTNYTNMFSNCNLLEEINLSGITSDKYANDNFKGVINLIPSTAKVYVLDEECVSLGQSINANLTFEIYVEPEEDTTVEETEEQTEEPIVYNKDSLEINYLF